MTDSSESIEKNIQSLVQATERILQGDYDLDAVVIDTEGVVSMLAQKINAMVVNLRSIEVPLTRAGDQTPCLLENVHTMGEIMAQATEAVLDKSDRLMALIEDFEKKLAQPNARDAGAANDLMISMKGAIYDIIASQSYQDVARQKIELIVNDFSRIRDWLVETLVVLHIRKNGTAENVQKKTQVLKTLKEPSPSGALKQDLIDDLLAEYGF
jgi:chemotaxis regulatin CheY-phosphate phosphatase CheZ